VVHNRSFAGRNKLILLETDP